MFTCLRDLMKEDTLLRDRKRRKKSSIQRESKPWPQECTLRLCYYHCPAVDTVIYRHMALINLAKSGTACLKIFPAAAFFHLNLLNVKFKRKIKNFRVWKIIQRFRGKKKKSAFNLFFFFSPKLRPRWINKQSVNLHVKVAAVGGEGEAWAALGRRGSPGLPGCPGRPDVRGFIWLKCEKMQIMMIISFKRDVTAFGNSSEFRKLGRNGN